MEPSSSRRFIGNVLWNFMGQASVAIISFFAFPVIVRGLSVSLYGIYALVGVVCGYFSFLQLGLSSATIKYIAEHLGKGNQEGVCRSFWSCVSAYFFLGLLGMGLIMASAVPVTVRFLKISPDLQPVCVYALRLGGVGFFVSMLTASVAGAVIGAGRFDIVNRLSVMLSALQMIATVIVLKAGYSLNEVIIVSIVVSVFGLLLFWNAAVRILPVLSEFRYDPSMLGRLFKFGGYITISSVVGPLLMNVDKLFLTSLRGVSALTYYSVPFSVADKLSMIRSSFTTVLFPTFSFYEGKHDRSVSAELHFVSILAILFMYTFFLFFFVFFGTQFFRIWMGADFAQRSTLILIILVFAGAINAAAGPSLSALQGMGKPNLPALFHVSEAVVYVPLCYFLITRYGGLGAALAWLFRVTADTLLLNNFTCRLLGVSIAGLYRRLLGRGAVPAAGCLLSFIIVKAMCRGTLGIACGTGVVFIVYCFLIWFFGLTDPHREKMREFVRGVTRGADSYRRPS